MVDENQFVVEFLLDDHNHNVMVGELYGKMGNVMRVTKNLIIKTKNHEKKKI